MLDIKSALILGGSGGSGGPDPRVSAISNALQMNGGGMYRKTLSPYKEIPKFVYNRQTKGRYGPNNEFGHAYYRIEGGATLYITGGAASNPTAHPLVSFYNAAGDLLGVHGEQASTDYTAEQVVAPEGATIAIVNKIHYTVTIKVDMEVPSSGSDVIDNYGGDINTLQAQVDKLANAGNTGVEVGETLAPSSEVPRSLYNVVQKKIYGDHENYGHAFYDVRGGDYYFVSGSAASDISFYPLCAFYDSEMNYIDSFGLERIKLYTDELIQAPKDAVTLVVNKGRADAVIRVKQGVVDEDEGQTYSLSFAEALIRETNKNPFRFPPSFTGGFVSFVCDDLLTDLDSIASIFEEYQMPLCVAAIPDRLDVVATHLQETRGSFYPGMSMRAIMTAVLNNGGEIMTHNTQVVTAENQNDYDFMYGYFVKSKRTLTAAGFPPRGLIRAGGTDSISMTPEIERWLIGFYDYANIGTADNYALERISINQPLADIKTAIDDAVTNGQWIRFMMHGYDYGGGETFTGEADLREILSYVQNSGIQVATFATVYDGYGSSLLMEKIMGRL